MMVLCAPEPNDESGANVDASVSCTAPHPLAMNIIILHIENVERKQTSFHRNRTETSSQITRSSDVKKGFLKYKNHFFKKRDTHNIT